MPRPDGSEPLVIPFSWHNNREQPPLRTIHEGYHSESTYAAPRSSKPGPTSGAGSSTYRSAEPLSLAETAYHKARSRTHGEEAFEREGGAS